MPKRTPNTDADLVIKFGGGLHSSASEEEIDERECAAGQNFDLDVQNRQFRNRNGFDLIGQVPNGSEIRGFACLIKTDGTVSVLVQAGATVYEWDGASTFTSVGTVDASAKIRGRLEHNWQLTDKVLITDINLQEEVYEWDGTTFQAVTFTDEAASSFGTFRAKYCVVSDERAWFSNVHDNGTNYPHLIVGSKRSDYTNITVSNRPSSALSDEDPFFFVQPDNRAINGMVEAFGQVITSSMLGSIFHIQGSTATNFSIDPLYPRSGASGVESVTYIGNDVMFGRQGRLESLSSTDRFGDVETDDLSLRIKDAIETYDDWILVYNARTQRVFCFPSSQSEAWVFHKSLGFTELSPWTKWTTVHETAMMPTAVMNMLDPVDGLEYVFFGDANGNFYRLEGSGATDAGANEITVERLSKLFKVPSDAEAFNIHGWILYRKPSSGSATIRLRFEFSGVNVFNQEITVSISAESSRNVYSGGVYYGAGSYYGTPFEGRLTRQKFAAAGRSTEAQLRITVEGSTGFEINEVGLRFEAAS